MAYSAIASGVCAVYPWVVEYGSARIINNTYKGKGGGGDWNFTEFLRLTTAGTVTKAGDAYEAGGDEGIVDVSDGIHFWAVASFDDDVAAEDDIFKPVMKIATDTIFAAQIDSASAPTAAMIGDKPEWHRGAVISSGSTGVGDYSKGYVGDGATEGALEIVNIWSQAFDYDPNADEAGVYGIVYFKLLDSVINNTTNQA